MRTFEVLIGFSNITTVILVGGMVTRIQIVVPHRQRVLVEVRKRLFLTFLLDELLSAGVCDVVISTGHRADEVHAKLGNAYKSLRLAYSKEKEPLGTGGALRLALPHLSSDLVLIMNGDSYINADLNNFLEWFKKKTPTAALILTKTSDTGRYGRVALAENGHIQGFEEKGESESPSWINAGVYLMKKRLLESIPSGRPYSLEQDFFPGLIGKGLYGYGCKGEFLDIGTPESYLLAEDFFARISPSKLVSRF